MVALAKCIEGVPSARKPLDVRLVVFGLVGLRHYETDGPVVARLRRQRGETAFPVLGDVLAVLGEVVENGVVVRRRKDWVDGDVFERQPENLRARAAVLLNRVVEVEQQRLDRVAHVGFCKRFWLIVHGTAL